MMNKKGNGFIIGWLVFCIIFMSVFVWAIMEDKQNLLDEVYCEDKHGYNSNADTSYYIEDGECCYKNAEFSIKKDKVILIEYCE